MRLRSDLTDDLGAVGNLFCDKTGTLTSNQMVRAESDTVVFTDISILSIMHTPIKLTPERAIDTPLSIRFVCLCVHTCVCVRVCVSGVSQVHYQRS